MRLWSQVQLPFLTLRILLCLDPSPPWDLFSAIALILLSYLIINSNLDTGVGYMNYLIGSAIGSCIVDGFHLLLLGKPLTKFKYVGNRNENVHRVWWKKFFDVMCVTHSPRGIGWNYQVKNIPPAPRQPRLLFILRSTLLFASNTVLFEVARLYLWYNPAFSSGTIGVRGYVAQCIDTVAFAGLTYWGLNAIYFAMASGSVVIGMYEPKMWPDLFGAWGDAYTVRQFWGRTWHQNMRRYLASLGKATSSALGFKPGSRGSSYTQLYVAFFLSGLIHTGGDIVLSSSTSTASWSFFSMPFFLSQACIITFEDMVIWIAGRLRVKGSIWTRILGYVWVAACLGWCASGFVKNIVRAGGGMSNPGVDASAMDSNLVQAVLGMLGFDIGALVKSWFSEA